MTIENNALVGKTTDLPNNMVIGDPKKQIPHCAS
jgi:hypothetical protein